ncbi:MAG: hypothetical protein FWB91_11845 [Defluviitaleaceae bacterium]|nr:hypothetical protein [Defluviitaleaceae bacterium]
MDEHDIKVEQTPYETGPVESLSEALYAFVEAYDKLQAAIGQDAECDFAHFRDLLKLTMNRPIIVTDENRPPLSLYEIGVLYFPDTGKYSARKSKLEKALRQRGDDIRALFVQQDGLLPRLCEILPAFLEEELPSEVFSASMRFLNECRRLTAMWS